MKKIVVLSDFSEKSRHAAEFALHIAVRLEADLLLFNAFELSEQRPPDATTFNWRLKEYFEAEDENKTRLKRLKDWLQIKYLESYSEQYKPRIICKCKEDRQKQLGTVTREFAQEENAWLIIMGSKGEESLSNFASGTNTHAVVTTTQTPVLFVPPNAPIKDIRKIAIATDYGEAQYSPLSFLQEFKDAFQSDIMLTHVRDSEQKGEYPETTEVSVFDLAGRRKARKVLFTDLYGNEVDDTVRKFALKSSADILGLIFPRENVYHRIFNSSLTDLLTENVHLPLLVFPGPDNYGTDQYAYAESTGANKKYCR